MTPRAASNLFGVAGAAGVTVSVGALAGAWFGVLSASVFCLWAGWVAHTNASGGDRQ